MSTEYIWRGGQKIPLAKEPEYFTAVIPDAQTHTRVRGLSGVDDVKQIHREFFKIKIDPNNRDQAMDQIRSAQIQGVCHHAYHPLNDRTTRYYLTEEIIVRFNEGLPLSRVEEILRAHGLKPLRRFGSGNTYHLQVTKSTGKNPVKCSNDLAEYQEVAFAEPNLINRFQPQDISPSDDLFPLQWHLKSRQDVQLAEDADINILEAWNITKGRRDVVVAVIDDGFDISHPDLSGDSKVVFPKDYVDGDSEPFPEGSRGDYHGTPCAGVAIAEENGSGVVGAAPGCAFLPIRFDLAAGDNELWEIFDHAGRHADVISCSWGPVPVFAPLSTLLIEKFTEITTNGGPRGKGAVILFAAGNYNAPIYDPNNQGFNWFIPQYGLQTTTGPILNGNCAHPDVMAIAASNSLNQKSAYSNWGDQISVAAPSNNFHPIDQQVWVPGLGITTTDNERRGAGFTPNSRYTNFFGGTSSATPLVAGVAGLVISANPQLTAREVRQIIEETADKITDDSADIVLGHNKGFYDANQHSEWFGFGKINAGKAVRRAAGIDTSLEQPVTEDIEEDPETEVDQDSPDGVIKIEGNIQVSGEASIYKVKVQDRIHVRLEGPDEADFDLYLRKGQAPTVTNYDARASDLGSSEEISFQVKESGEYFIMVKSYVGTGKFNLLVSID